MKDYKLRIRAVNINESGKPIPRIVSVRDFETKGPTEHGLTAECYYEGPIEPFITNPTETHE